MIKDGTNKPYVCLAALTLFGNGAFIVDCSSETGVDIISAIFNLILTALSIFLVMKTAKFLKSKTENGSRFLLSFTLFLLSAICLLFSLFSLANLIRISLATFAKGIRVGIVVLSLILVVLALTLSKKTSLLKFSLLFLPVVAGLTLLIFFFSLPFMSIKYLEIKAFPEASFILNQTAERFIFGTLPVIVPLAVLCFNKLSAATLGGTIGAGLTALTVINTILIFGSHFSSELSLPYFKAVSTVSLGELFSRMDAVLYPVCFFSGVIRVSVQTVASVKLYKKAKNILKISK